MFLWSQKENFFEDTNDYIGVELVNTGHFCSEIQLCLRRLQYTSLMINVADGVNTDTSRYRKGDMVVLGFLNDSYVFGMVY